MMPQNSAHLSSASELAFAFCHAELGASVNKVGSHGSPSHSCWPLEGIGRCRKEGKEGTTAPGPLQGKAFGPGVRLNQEERENFKKRCQVRVINKFNRLFHTHPLSKARVGSAPNVSRSARKIQEHRAWRNRNFQLHSTEAGSSGDGGVEAQTEGRHPEMEAPGANGNRGRKRCFQTMGGQWKPGPL
jgi:hypothetical protein